MSSPNPAASHDRPRARADRRPTAPAKLAHAAAILLLLFAASAPPALGEQPVTAQAMADDGAFLVYAPAPARPAGLCLIDTGVNENPDTESTVIERTAIDGGTGEDVSPDQHGTILAMLAAGPALANGWGVIGTAPNAIKIVSVRILEPGQSTFPFSYYTDGITTCLQREQKDDIKVINLSLGNTETPTSQEYEALANAIHKAEDHGVAVVAAAGNDDGGPLDYPAAYPFVLSVGASDTATGELCAFSNRGAGLRMTAPGCDLDGADPLTGAENYNYSQGSSEASDIDSAALGALRAYLPELSATTAEEDLTHAAGGALNIAQAFRDAGLGAIVAAGEAAEPHTPPATSMPSPATQSKAPAANTTTAIPALLGRLAAPRAKLARHDGHLELLLEDRPSGTRVQARLLGYRRGSRRPVVLRTLSGCRSTIAVGQGTIEIAVRYTDPQDIDRSSPWVTIHTTYRASPKRGRA
jgi:hypothetical protein